VSDVEAKQPDARGDDQRTTADRRDEELLADYLAGNLPAFEALAQRYSSELFGFLLRFVNNPAVAEDLLQETFLQVHLAGASFDPTRAFKPWLYTIAANKARDFLRSRTRKQEQSLDIQTDGASPSQMIESETASAAEEFSAEENRARVRGVIDQMPEHLKMILLLGYFQQLPYAEIAQVLDIPIGTVKSRLHSAVTQFAKMWKAQERTPLSRS
jgi:RNA polymerase sigma-70 factor, ECF subfamily